MATPSINELYTTLVERVYEDDAASQRHYLSMVESHRHIPVDYLMQRGAVFIPNNDYIRHYLGSSADAYGAGLYEGEYCPWALFVILPIMDLVGDVVGLVGWDAQNKFKELEEGAKGLPMYKVSNKLTFARDKYFLSDIDLLRSKFDSRTIFIVDGVFDSVALNYRGLPAISLLGSSVSSEILYFLRWYKNVYIIQDNDTAGTKLYLRLKKALPRVYRVFQDRSKDIEELLRTDGVDGPLTQQLLGLLTQPAEDDYYLH